MQKHYCCRWQTATTKSVRSFFSLAFIETSSRVESSYSTKQTNTHLIKHHMQKLLFVFEMNGKTEAKRTIRQFDTLWNSTHWARCALYHDSRWYSLKKKVLECSGRLLAKLNRLFYEFTSCNDVELFANWFILSWWNTPFGLGLLTG